MLEHDAWGGVAAGALLAGGGDRRRGKTGGAPVPGQRKGEEETVDGLICKIEKSRGFSVKLKFPAVLGLK